MKATGPTILPCPLCGASASLFGVYRHGTYYGRVRCLDSGCGVQGPERRTDDEAAAAWNMRDGEPARHRHDWVLVGDGTTSAEYRCVTCNAPRPEDSTAAVNPNAVEILTDEQLRALAGARHFTADDREDDRGHFDAVARDLKLLLRDVEAAVSERQRKTIVCSYCGEVSERPEDPEEAARATVAHIVACEKRPEARMADAMLALHARIDELEGQHVSRCLLHRCPSHYDVPQINTTDGGSECGACVRDMVRVAQREVSS